jgi:hypothetical protein
MVVIVARINVGSSAVLANEGSIRRNAVGGGCTDSGIVCVAIRLVCLRGSELICCQPFLS